MLGFGLYSSVPYSGTKCHTHYARWLRHQKHPHLPRDDETFFWSRVDKNGPVHIVLQTRCWIWTGATMQPWRYGRIRLGRVHTGSHRYSYFLANGQWPNPMCLHRCDNPPCVNPTHLFEGTNLDNARDKLAKGRHRSGRPVQEYCIRGHRVAGDNAAPRNDNDGRSSVRCRSCRDEHARNYRERKWKQNLTQKTT